MIAVAMTQAVNEAIEAVQDNHEGIPDVVTVIGASAPSRHGHFAPKSWRMSRDDEAEPMHEIFLSGESLKRGGRETFGTIVHELAHAYCHAHDIQDTSNRGRYHNKDFKAVAEMFGLEIEKAPTIGFSVTTVPPETAEKYNHVIHRLDEALVAYRYADLKAAQTKKRTTYRLTCACEGEPLPIAKKFLLRSLSCDDCGEQMNVETVEPGDD